MKIIVLEHPRWPSEPHFNDIAHTPLWSCLMGGYAAAALAAAGHEVIYLDATGVDEKGVAWDFCRVREKILGIGPRMLCVNTVYFWEQTPRLFEMFAQLRAAGFDAHICLFGFFPTLAWHAVLSHAPTVDTIAVGEPERTLCDLAHALERSLAFDGTAYGDIPGLASGGPDHPRLAGIRAPEPDPDRFPWPERNLRPGETAMVLASRGCYNHCTFCPIPSFYADGALWRGRSTAAVAAEIEGLAGAGVTHVYFADPNFMGPGRNGRERAMDLADRMRGLGISFGMETRPGDLTRDLLQELKAGGLSSLLLGVESGSSGLLDRMDKQHSSMASERAIGLCRDVGIEPEIGFLMFLPESRLFDIAENLAFLERNRLLDRLDRTANLLSHRQIVLMGTSGYRRCRREGRLIPAGPFGFEGAVAYADHRVRRLADLVPYACLRVIREMGRPGSPIHWTRDPKEDAPRRINDWLVESCRALVGTAQSAVTLPDVEETRSEILQNFLAELRI